MGRKGAGVWLCVLLHHVFDQGNQVETQQQVSITAVTCVVHSYSHNNNHQHPTSSQLKPWHMEENDTTLIDLIPFLEAIVRTNVPDVRDVVRSYDGLDIPTAFKERMQKVQEKQRAQQGAASFLSARRSG